MKKGDWVLTDDGRVGYITLTNYLKEESPPWHLVWLVDGDSKFSSLRSEEGMTLLDKSVGDILTAVNN